MSSIDQRVVEIKLDNKQFDSGVSSTMSALDKLKAALKFDGAKKSMADLQSVGKGFSLDNIGRSVDDIKNKFSALSVAGIAALGALASKAVNFGINQIGKMFDPVMDGFAEYELKMGSIQTIMANTSRHGTSLETVNAELDKLNEYADLTIYNFAEMTKNASLFTASGMKIEDATAMIKGFSNEAAASGANSSDASRAAYQLTQAMNNGVVKLQDWKSITNAGMGTANMRDGLIQVADSMGTFNENTTTASKAGENFNASLENGWLTADVMSKYLQIMTGDYDEAQIAAMGFDAETSKMLYTQAQNALDAATKVRTFSQMVGAIKEGIGSGWAQSIELLVGDFTQATELFTGMFNVVDGVIDRMADARNQKIKEFVDAGGRDDIIQGFKNIYEAALAFIQPIQKVIAEIFPRKSGAELTKFSRAFVKLTEIVKMGAGALGSGFGLALKLVLVPLKFVVTLIGNLVKGVIAVIAVLGGAAIGLMTMIGGIVNLATSFGKMIAQSDGLHRVFTALKDVWETIQSTLIALGTRIKNIGTLFGKTFDALNKGARADALMLLRAALEKVGFSAQTAYKYARDFINWFDQMKAKAQDFANNISFDPLVDALKRVNDFLLDLKNNFLDVDLTPNIDMSKIRSAKVETDKFKGAWEVFAKFMGGLGRFVGEVMGGLGEFVIVAIDKIKNYLSTLTFQEVLALVNTGFFIMMYKAFTGFLNDMSGVSKSFSGVMDNISGALERFGGEQPETLATKILKIAIAIGILAAAAYVLSGVDAASLGKALGAIGVMLAELAITMKVMSSIEFGEDAKIIKAGIALGLMAIAILILSHAVQNFEGLSWNSMAKGLVGVAVLLGALALFTKIAELNGGGIKASVGLIILAVAIRLLASSVEAFGEMDTKVLQKGLLTLGILMVGLMAMTKVMNGAQLTSAAIGLLILSASLLALSFALKYYATLEWGMLLDGLAKLAVVLIGVGIAARALPANLPVTAIGLILVAGALAILVPVLSMLGNLPIPVIVQGLATIAVALGILAVAMRVMSAPNVLAGAAALVIVVAALYLLVPLLVTLGSLPWEVVLLGLGALAGVFLILGAAGMLLGPAVPVLIALAAIIMALGLAALVVGAGMALFGLGFALMVAAVVSGGAIILGALEALIMMIPLFAQQLALGIIAFAVVIRDAGPALVAAITTVLISILQAIENATPQAGQTFATLIMTIVNVVTSLAPRITERFVIMLLSIMTTLGTYVPQIVEKAMQLMRDFLSAVSDNIGPIVDEATRLMVEFMDGIERNIPQLVESGERMVRTFIREVGAALLGGVDDLIDKGKELAAGIVTGMTRGISNGLASIKEAATSVAKSALDAAKRFLGISSPSKEFIKVGRYSDEGLALGMKNYTGVVTKSAEGVGEAAIFALKKSIGKIPAAINTDMSLNPTIKPVLDLSAIRQGAQAIDPLLAAQAISFDSAMKSALAADTGYRSNRNAAEEISTEAREQAAKIEFIQHNTSPKALDSIEIYRQTRNQLALMKEEFNASPR